MLSMLKQARIWKFKSHVSAILEDIRMKEVFLLLHHAEEEKEGFWELQNACISALAVYPDRRHWKS